MADVSQLLDTAKIIGSRLIRADIPGIKRILSVSTLFDADKILTNFSHMNALMLSETAKIPSTKITPFPQTPKPFAQTYTHLGKSFDFATWTRNRNICSLLILKNGAVAYENYSQGASPTDQRISWSMSKSFVSATFGILQEQGHIPDLDTPVGAVVPSLKGSAYEHSTIRNVLQMSSGVAFTEDYLDYHSDINRMGRLIATGGSLDAFAQGMKKQEWKPGTYCHYVSIDTHVLGMIMRAATKRGINDLFSELLFAPMGFETPPYFITDSLGEPFILGGLNMTTRDYARFGLLFAQGGQLDGKQIVPADWVAASTRASAPPPDPETAKTPDGQMAYGYQWWVPPNAQAGECLAVGIYGQVIYINTKAQTVIAINAGDTRFRDDDGAPRLENIAVCRQITASLE